MYVRPAVVTGKKYGEVTTLRVIGPAAQLRLDNLKRGGDSLPGKNAKIGCWWWKERRAWKVWRVTAKAAEAAGQSRSVPW